jgi:hypothetical protein
VPRFNGLIQHSFALQNHGPLGLRGDESIKGTVSDLFALPASGGVEFQAKGLPCQGLDEADVCSPLVKGGLTTLDSGERVNFLRWDPALREYAQLLPGAFSWASRGDEERVRTEEEPWGKFIFAKAEEKAQPSLNDFLVGAWGSSEPEARTVSEMLCELLATRRSLLFGLSLANRFVNVMLPHALLTPASAGEAGHGQVGSWILQPLISLIRVVDDANAFRRMYSLTFFLIPVESSCCEARTMPEREISEMVNAGWSLASCPTALPRFDVSGPLPGYVTRLAPAVKKILSLSSPAKVSEDDAAGAKWDGGTLRGAAEAITFGVALKVAQGQAHAVSTARGREIGDEVITSLGNSRVSSVVVVDPKFDSCHLDDSRPKKAYPGSLGRLLQTLAEEVRIPSSRHTTQSRKYRLDRPYIAHKNCAMGVLPSNRCLVVTSDEKAQRGRWDSGLMQAGWMAYTVIGAANAIGTIRAINHDLETVERSSPEEIGDLEHEVAVDLHEIYDLDITWEAYRLRYRRLRDLLGITSDYKALHSKLDALYRETSARFEAKTQERLFWWTAAIVVLSFLILIGTIAVVVKA